MEINMTTEIENIEYTQLEQGKSTEKASQTNDVLSLIGDVTVELQAMIGQCELSLQDLQNLKKEQVITLAEKTNEPISLLLNGKTIACGELVVVDDNFGIRITELTPS